MTGDYALLQHHLANAQQVVIALQREVKQQDEEIKRLREALVPFANIARASVGMLEPHMMMHSPGWYQAALRALEPKSI